MVIGQNNVKQWKFHNKDTSTAPAKRRCEMRLPNYITGITDLALHLNKMDGRLFKKIGFEIARKLNGEVMNYFQPSVPLHYFRLEIKIGERVVSILLHEYFPYVAIASYENMLKMHFLDDEDIKTELYSYYTVLEATFLNEPFNKNNHDLSDIELKNEKHWRPNTNGKVIYNCWD